jgi:Zinc-binding loop region of homing endonuclease
MPVRHRAARIALLAMVEDEENRYSQPAGGLKESKYVGNISLDDKPRLGPLPDHASTAPLVPFDSYCTRTAANNNRGGSYKMKAADTLPQHVPSKHPRQSTKPLILSATRGGQPWARGLQPNSRGSLVNTVVVIPAGVDLTSSTEVAKDALSNTIGAFKKVNLPNSLDLAWFCPVSLVPAHDHTVCWDTGVHRQTKFVGTQSKGEREKYYIYHVAFCARSEECCAAYNTRGLADEVSHTCGNACCINPEHLCLEHASVNKDRSRCHAVGLLSTCSGPICICNHDPPCVFTAPPVAGVAVDVRSDWL